MKHIYDKDFKYTPASKTDIRKTIARIKREQKEAAEQAKSKRSNVKLWRQA